MADRPIRALSLFSGGVYGLDRAFDAVARRMGFDVVPVAVRFLDDGRPLGLVELHRPDILRACGNAVVEAQAEEAIWLLWQRLFG